MKTIIFFLAAVCFFCSCKKQPKNGPNQYVVNPYAFEAGASGLVVKRGWGQLEIADQSDKTFTCTFTTSKKCKVYALGAYLPKWELDKYIVFLLDGVTQQYLIYDSVTNSQSVTGWLYRDVSAQGKEALIIPGVTYTAGIIFKPNPNQPRTKFYTIGFLQPKIIVPFTQGSITYNGTYDGLVQSPATRLDGIVDIGYYTTE